MASSRASSVGLSLGVGIFVLTVATAGIHLYLALSAIGSMGFNFGVMLFILNGLGYLGLLAVLQLPIRQLACLPERCAMGPDSLRSADDRALFHHGSGVHDHWLRRQGDRSSPDRAAARRCVHGVLLAFWRDT